MEFYRTENPNRNWGEHYGVDSLFISLYYKIDMSILERQRNRDSRETLGRRLEESSLEDLLQLRRNAEIYRSPLWERVDHGLNYSDFDVMELNAVNCLLRMVDREISLREQRAYSDLRAIRQALGRGQPD